MLLCIEYSILFVDTVVAFWVTNPCRITRNVEQTKMYVCTLKNIYSSRCSHIAVQVGTELNSIGRMLVYIHSQQRNEICENYS